MATAEVIPRNGKYLTFQLSRQYFGIRSECVRLILPSTDITVISNRLPFLYGSVPANGRLIPVLDLRQMLGLDVRPLRAGASAVVITLDEDCPVRLAGLIADKLSEVVAFRATEIRGSTAQLRIQGRPYGRPKTLLHPEELLTPEQWSLLWSVVL